MTDEILHDIIAHTDKLSNWTQTISVIHDGVSIDISSAANGKLSTIPVGAPNSSQLGLGNMQHCMLNGRVNSHNPGCMLVIVSLPTNSHGRVNSHNQGCMPQLCHFLLTFINQYLSRKFLFLINDASMQCIHY